MNFLLQLAWYTSFGLLWMSACILWPSAVSGSSSVDEGLYGSSFFLHQSPGYPKDCKEALQQCAQRSSDGVYLVKPVGYVEPFEAFCDNELDRGGWMLIQRRHGGSISFNRNWEEFKNGFGFLSGEYWIGCQKLSYLSNQAVYELRIDITLSDGSSFYIAYDTFRISDEFGRFAIVSIGQYEGNSESVISSCPINMTYNKHCQYQHTCEEPLTNRSFINCIDSETCICKDKYLRSEETCIPPSKCGCFVSDINSVITNGEYFVNADCTERCTCIDNHLSCNFEYRCNFNAICRADKNIGQCYCKEGYEGNGETCSSLYTDCYDAYLAGERENGVYSISPTNWSGSPFNVTCDMSSNGGGWTVFQRRMDGVTDFYRNWTSYTNGFGSFSGDFWLGNERLYFLTNQATYSLRVDIVTAGNVPKYDEYASFRVGDESTKYQIVDLGSHSGNAGHGMQYSSGKPFSTYDEDNDGCENHNCAERHKGAWWYTSLTDNGNSFCSYCDRRTFCDQFQYSSSCNSVCTKANLNGDYNGGKGENINWHFGHICYAKSSEMKIRPSV